MPMTPLTPTELISLRTQAAILMRHWPGPFPSSNVRKLLHAVESLVADPDPEDLFVPLQEADHAPTVIRQDGADNPLF